MKVHGRDLDLQEMRALVGTSRQVLGWRQIVLDDGVERGVRAIEARTAGGIDITCLLDRALDVADATIDGLPVAWRAPTGYAGPWYYDASPMGFQRTMGGGLFVTAGLDHVLFPVREAELAYAFPLIAERDYPMHGRIAHTPARLVELREDLVGPDPSLRVRAIATQASVFGEYLELDRTIETRVGTPLVTVSDRVTNLGGTPAPHMMLYHVNLGFPLLDVDTQPFAATRLHTAAASANDGSEEPFSPFGAPRPGTVEQVYCHRLQEDPAGLAHVGVFNPRLALAVGLSYSARALPYLLEWRVRRAGVYALGFEPSTADLEGRTGARHQRRLRLLEPGESITYDLAFRAVRAHDLAEATAAWGLADTQAGAALPTPPSCREHTLAAEFARGRLAGMVAVITGSTTGIGEAIARRFAAEGASVMIHGRNADGAHSVVEAIRSVGGEAQCFLADLADPASSEQLIDAAISAFGQLDVLVNNAAVTGRSTLESTDAAYFDSVIAVNLRAPLLLTRAALPHFRKRGCGRVINIGSINAYAGANNLLAYSISKGGLMTMSRNLASAHAQEGILFTHFNVGWVLTPNEYMLKLDEGFAEDWHLDTPREWAPSGALLSVDMIAHFALAFADPAGGPVNGTVLELEQFPVIGVNSSKDPEVIRQPSPVADVDGR